MSKSVRYTRGRIRRGGIVLALSALSVVAAAGTASAAGRPATKANLTNIPISVGTSSAIMSNLPFYVAYANNDFAKAGLKVNFTSFSGGDPATMAAFTQGDINVIAGGSVDDIEYIDLGVIPKNFGQFFLEYSGNSNDIVASKSITSVQQLEGKTLGISGPNDGDELYLEAVLNYYKIPLSSVTFVTVGSPASRLVALQNGTIQATAESNSSRSTSAQVGNVVLPSAKSPVDFPGFMDFASATLLKHVAEMKKFTNVITKDTKWIRTHELQATSICETTTGGTEANCAAAITSGFVKSLGGPYTWSSTGAVQESAITTTIKLVATLVPKHVSLTASKLVDTAIAGTQP